MMSKKWKEHDPEEELREQFRAFDQDGSGYVTLDEFTSVIQNLSECYRAVSHQLLTFFTIGQNLSKAELADIHDYLNSETENSASVET